VEPFNVIGCRGRALALQQIEFGVAADALGQAGEHLQCYQQSHIPGGGRKILPGADGLENGRAARHGDDGPRMAPQIFFSVGDRADAGVELFHQRIQGGLVGLDRIETVRVDEALHAGVKVIGCEIGLFE